MLNSQNYNIFDDFSVSKSPLSTSPYNSRLLITETDLKPNALINGLNFIEQPPPEPPPSEDTETLVERKRATDIQRRIYAWTAPCFNSPGGPDPTGWLGFSDLTKRTFIGNPAPNYGDLNVNGQRAYPFSMNPTDLHSTPWHNVIYETVNQTYFAGFRAFHFQFPWGNDGSSFILHPLIMLETFTSTTDARTCPARIKGFKEAIKDLLEGKYAPQNRPAMTEPCDVLLYCPGGGGWGNYRVMANQYWESLGSTRSERDAAYLQKLDEMVEYFRQMKSETSNGGILSIVLDVGVATATPNTIEVYRAFGFENEPIGYKSDVVELTNWYLRNKLHEIGIPVLPETRHYLQDNLTSGYWNGQTTIIKTGNTISPKKDPDWTIWASDVSFNWYTDPGFAAQNGDLYWQNNGYRENTDPRTKWIHLIGGSTLEPNGRVPFGLNTIVRYRQNPSSPLKTRDVGSWPGIQSSVYSPYYALTQLYAAADVYIDYLYRVTTEPTLKEEYNQKRLTKTFTTYTMPLWPFAGFNQLEVGPPSAPTEYAWWNASGVPNPNIQYMFPFNETSFNADPVNYGTTNFLENFWIGTWYYNGTGTGARAWWNINVRGNRTKIFDVLQDLATNYTPPNTPNTKPVWGTLSDPYYSNTIELILRQS